MPTFDTLAELNAFLERCDTTDAQRWVTGRGPGAGGRVHALAALERPALWMLPAERFAAVTRLSARVDTKSRVCVRQCFYSVPVRHVGSRVIVELGAETVTVHADGTRVASHVRGVHRRSEILDLDHNLEVLWRRSGAMPGSTALAQASSTGRFRPEHQQFWDAARRRDGDAAGTRSLCDVLLLVGVIANLSIYFSIHTLFTDTQRHRMGSIRLTAPVWSTISPRAVFVTLLAFVLVFRFKRSVLRVLGTCAAVGAAIYLATR